MKRKIALLCGGWSAEYVLNVIEGIKPIAEANNVDIFVFMNYGVYGDFKNKNLGEFQIFALPHYEDFDGVLILANSFNSHHIVFRERDRILKSKTPVLSLEYHIDGIPFLGTDNYSGTYELVSHLVKKHKIRRFAYIGGPLNNSESNERYKAFCDVLQQNNIPFIDEWIITDGNYSYDFAYLKAQSLFADKNNLPEAVVCINDESATACITIASQLNIRIPQDVKIVGFDNIDQSRFFYPSITTVNRSWGKLGERAMKEMIDIWNTKKTPNDCVIPTKPIYRCSCGCKKSFTKEQRNYCIFNSYNKREAITFTTQLNRIENIFIYENDFISLWNRLKKHFASNNEIEGSTCSFILKDNFNHDYINVSKIQNISIDYNEEMQTVINIKDNQICPDEKVSIRNLIPKSLESDKPSTYLFFPIHYDDNTYGYFVNKDCLKLIYERNGYFWTKLLNNNIEKTTQRFIYKKMNDELLNIYRKDELTGLLNRNGYSDSAARLFQDNNKNNIPSLIFFMDINNMKIINDKFGHLHGDLAIKTVAEAIKKSLNKNWIGVRYGGDEYFVIGTGTESDEIDFKNKVLNNLNESTKIMSLPYTLTISIGSKLFEPSTELTLDQTVNIVDKIMYEQKIDFHNKNKS